MALAKDGYFSGNPYTILNSPVDIVIGTYQYNKFTKDFETTFHELNRKTK